MSCIWFFLHHCFRDMVFINGCFRITARELLLETWYLRLTIWTCSKHATWMLQYLAKKSVSFRDYSGTCNLKYWCEIMSKTKNLTRISYYMSWLCHAAGLYGGILIPCLFYMHMNGLGDIKLQNCLNYLKIRYISLVYKGLYIYRH